MQGALYLNIEALDKPYRRDILEKVRCSYIKIKAWGHFKDQKGKISKRCVRKYYHESSHSA